MTIIVDENGKPIFNGPWEEGCKTDPIYQVANLSSLFTVCALALDAAESYRDDLRKRMTEDIGLVLQMGAVMASDTCSAVDHGIEAAKNVRRAA